MIKFIVSHDIDKFIDKLNSISLDIQTAGAEASSATALNLEEINPEYAVVDISFSENEFTIAAKHLGYDEDLIVNAKETFINTFKESFGALRSFSNGN